MFGRKRREIERQRQVIRHLNELDAAKNEALRGYQRMLHLRPTNTGPGQIWQIPTQGRRG